MIVKVDPFCRKEFSPQGERRAQQETGYRTVPWLTCTQVAAGRGIMPGSRHVPKPASTPPPPRLVPIVRNNRSFLPERKFAAGRSLKDPNRAPEERR